MSRSFGGRSLTTSSPIRIVPVGDVLEPGDHPQRRRLAAARRADEDDELAVRDLEVEVADRARPVRIDLRDVLERDLGHVPSELRVGNAVYGLPQPWMALWRRSRPRRRRRESARAAPLPRACADRARGHLHRPARRRRRSSSRSTSASRTRRRARSPASSSASTTSPTSGRTRTSARALRNTIVFTLLANVIVVLGAGAPRALPRSATSAASGSSAS